MSDVTPGFNHEIPGSIMTPNAVDTRIGRLEFFDGFPTADTTRTVYDHLDFLRAVEVFLHFIPATSVEAMRRGNVAMGISAPHQVMILDQLMDSNPLFLTATPTPCTCPGSSTWPPTGPSWSRFLRAAGRAPSTTRSSGSSSTWAGRGRPRAGRQVSDRARRLHRRLLRRPLPELVQLVDPARPARRRPPRGADGVVQGWAQDLPAVRGCPPARDGVQQRPGPVIQYDPRERLRLLRGAGRGHRA
jgi:hypothetical protein